MTWNGLGSQPMRPGDGASPEKPKPTHVLCSPTLACPYPQDMTLPVSHVPPLDYSASGGTSSGGGSPELSPQSAHSARQPRPGDADFHSTVAPITVQQAEHMRDRSMSTMARPSASWSLRRLLVTL